MILCSNCNNEIKGRKPSRRNINNFCSRKCVGEFQRKDLSGEKIGQLEVLEYDGKDKWGKTKFKCRCKCGKIISVLQSNLIASKKDGDSSKHRCRKCYFEYSSKYKKRKYVGEVSSRYFNNLKSKARQRKIVFEITQQEVWDQFLKQDRKCIYSGVELTWQDGCKDERGTASLDRRDSSKGYTKDNIQIVHKDINKMKLDHSEEYFIELCKLVVKNQK